jgi:transcription-repair coupling factor (superfamily II helicase)
MYVAMKDVEIRGAGNLLGGEQSGHIASVGFDLYVRMVGEAVAEFRGDAPAAPTEVKVELPVNAHLPHDYIPGERLRLDAYRRIAAIAEDADVAAVRDELADRFGALPIPVENLLEVAKFRAHARRAGLTEVTAAGTSIRFGPVALPESGVLRLQRLYPRTVVKPAVRTILVPRPTDGPVGSIGGTPLRDLDLLRWCRELVDAVLLDPITATTKATTKEGRS